MSSPVAEFDVNEALVRALLKAQHPDLADADLVLLGSGWDNISWRLGDRLMVRLPRRAMSAPLMLHEQRWLPSLATHLPLPIPAPVRIGIPSSDYPWAWSVVPWLDGQPGDRAALTNPHDAAQRLGHFLRALHHEAPTDAPRNPYRGVPLAERTAAVTDRLNQLADHLDPSAARQVWAWALAGEPWPGPPVWLHGDLHPANLLIDQGTLAAVIDFGDICSGDPATDVAGAWMLLPTSVMKSFDQAYGEMTPQLERRAVGWAVHFAVILWLIGLDHQPTYRAVAEATMTRAFNRFLGSQ